MIASPLVAQVRDLLEAEQAVNVQLPGGTLHVERRLPFLLVHRRVDSTDVASPDLLLAQASYLVVDGDDQASSVDALIGVVVAAARKAYGSVLVVELWESSEELRPTEAPFRLIAPTHRPPESVLEEMESSLLAIDLEHRRPTVVVDYADRWSPPGLPPLDGTEDFCHLGVEMPAVHRLASTGETLPFELKALQNQLGRAFKRAFHTFAHDHTTSRPAHFHELGRRDVTAEALEVDRRLAEIGGTVDLLLHVTPLNVPEAWDRFERSNADRAPEFLYRARAVDPDQARRQLWAVPVETVDDPTIAHMFIEKRNELDQQLSLVSDRNTPRFVLGSRLLYGDPPPDLVELATSVLTSFEPPTASSTLVDAEHLRQAAEEELSHYRRLDPSLTSRVEIRDDVPGVLVSAGNLLVGRRVMTPVHRVLPLLAHEIGTHVVTHHNGHRQPFCELGAGMAGYEPLQEGLAVFWEYLVGGLGADRLRLLAGRVQAVESVAEGAEFLDTFRLLSHHWGFEAESAFSIAMRVHRGGGFTKDAVYLRGLSAVLDYVAAGRPFERLHLGKVAHHHLELIEELEWRRVLEPPRLLPRRLYDDDVIRRLDHCRSGLTVLDLVETAA